MRVTIPTEGKEGLSEPVAGHFGQAKWYTIVDTETGEIEYVENTSSHRGGVGMPPEVIHKAGTDVVLCPFLGPPAVKLFDQFGIKAYVGACGTVEEALNDWEAGKLSEPDPMGMPPHEAGDCGHHHH